MTEHDARSSGVASSAPASEVGSLDGAALDAVVLELESARGDSTIALYRDVTGRFVGPAYSSDWADGGPIIEREQIDVWTRGKTSEGNFTEWVALVDGTGGFEGVGPTPLIAAMRAYVASTRAP